MAHGSVDRRGFLKGAAVTGAAALVPDAVAPAAAAPQAPTAQAGGPAPIPPRETDPTGEKKAPADPIEVPDLYATILSVLGVDFARELITPIGRPMQLCQGKPIERLLQA